MNTSSSAGPQLIRFLGKCESDLQLACNLFHQVFGQKLETDAWRWKYQAGPRMAGFNIVSCSPDGHELLGHVGASAFRGNLAGQHVVMVQVSDVMVHPDARSGHQPTNLYRRLMSVLQAEIHRVLGNGDPIFAYGFPGERPSKLGQRVGLYRPMYRCEDYSLTDSETTLSNWVWQCKGHQIHQVAWPQAHEWVNLIARNPSRHHVQPAVHKTAAYLLWRYGLNPHHSYQIWVHTRWGQPQTWWITRSDIPGTIIDAAWPALGQTDPDILARFAHVIRAAAVNTWVLPDRSQVAEPVKPTPIHAVEIALANGWHPNQPQPRFHPGDTDVY